MRIDYDPVSGRSQVTWGRPLPAPTAVAVGAGALWGIDPIDQVVMRIDPATGRRTHEVRPGSDPSAIAAGAGAVWVANEGDNSVSRIDPQTNLVVQTIGVRRGPVAVATGAGAVWVALADAGAVARIDPRTEQRDRHDRGGAPAAGRRGGGRPGLGHGARLRLRTRRPRRAQR